MVIYPVAVAVTQAKVQLVTDETAKAPVTTISNDLQAVAEVQREAEQASRLDLKA
jgi:cell shape-determining protein MreC